MVIILVFAMVADIYFQAKIVNPPHISYQVVASISVEAPLEDNSVWVP